MLGLEVELPCSDYEAVFAVTGFDNVVLLSPISAGVLRDGLDLAAWQSVAPSLSVESPDSAIAQYICVVLTLTGNHGVRPSCDLPFGIEIHRGKRLSVRTTTEAYDFTFDEAGHLASVSRVGA